ncbi:GntR family transcriptional regulator [Roseovarius pelagicus]|uniref:GntR family transcriptional regulator n=1 Tax=Roseovarius pelagicus TaxID=2980108 RepID=A0ABY6DE02_9RHOB|nr:GntR family transcriptional regulator [Roseovarius pelagicus]UXX82040.1 GntR family transcriptional regulator [Roseovarius pelagicus]
MKSTDTHSWVHPIAKENLGDRAYFALRTALMGGQLKPGEKLHLRPMSKRFGISATPMREAFLRLVSLDALALDARGTVMVPELTLDELIEIRDIRLDLEGRAAANAATSASDSEVDTLEDIHTRLSSAFEGGDHAEAINLNTQFHLTLCRAGKMPIVLEIVENLWVRCGPLLSHLYDRGNPFRDVHPHLTVIDGLRARDPVMVRTAICHDIRYGGEALLRHAKPNI